MATSPDFSIDSRRFTAKLHKPQTETEHELVACALALQGVASAGLSAVLTGAGGERITAPLHQQFNDTHLAPTRQFQALLDRAGEISPEHRRLARAGAYVLEAMRQANRVFTACSVNPDVLADATALLDVKDRHDVGYYFDFPVAAIGAQTTLLARDEAIIRFVAEGPDKMATWAAVRTSTLGRSVTALASNGTGDGRFNETFQDSQFLGMQTFALAIRTALETPGDPSTPAITQTPPL